MFKKILIANRGEIACRVIKTARAMGIATVAVHSDADAAALHVELADEAVAIGPAPAAESYLVVDRILAAVGESGADAVHPGYGFLSENADFVRALIAAGVAFIGPGPDAIAAMGDKIEAKKLASLAGLTTVPGHLGVVETAAEAVEIATEVGYPVMIKASAGGGGKGMRLARSAEEVSESFASARNEAKSSFADDRIFIEKYIPRPRHIEIQVLADAHGNCIHLGERECSVQRRHQKVIEEAPSPFLDEATRAAMGAQAVALAKAVDYCSAGTVEFIVDAERNFYFLEMNTRLQVEHPVTEMVYGVDLVEQMILIAAGETLSIAQSDVVAKGWAIEARLYAEDPERGFLPSTGRLVRCRPPAEDGNIRVDTGVGEGAEISLHYDPMIAKLIAHGPDRAAAIRHLRAGLDRYYVRGISHNLTFLNAVIGHPRFIEGDISTDFLAEAYPDGFDAAAIDSAQARVFLGVALFIHLEELARAAEISGQSPHFEAEWGVDWVVSVGAEAHTVTISTEEDGYDVTCDGAIVAVRSHWHAGAPVFVGAIDGHEVVVQVDRRDEGVRLSHGGGQVACRVRLPRAAELARHMLEKIPPDTSKYLLCPMPGLVVTILVAEGEDVSAGQALCSVEAMKMENILRAERDGVVAAVRAAPGDSLAVDAVIMEFA